MLKLYIAVCLYIGRLCHIHKLCTHSLKPKYVGTPQPNKSMKQIVCSCSLSKADKKLFAV